LKSFGEPATQRPLRTTAEPAKTTAVRQRAYDIGIPLKT
jgi:hypothetical protein